MSEKLIIGPDRYNCPVCGVEWYEYDLYHLNIEGCAGCGRKFNLEDYLYDGESLWHKWREMCYYRMRREYENGGKI